MVAKVKIISAEEAETVDAMICEPASWPEHFKDNCYDRCSRCKRAVQFRPYAPKRPAKICLVCFASDYKGKPKAAELQRHVANMEAKYGVRQ